MCYTITIQVMHHVIYDELTYPLVSQRMTVYTALSKTITNTAYACTLVTGSSVLAQMCFTKFKKLLLSSSFFQPYVRAAPQSTV